jgi:hypothetical protein
VDRLEQANKRLRNGKAGMTIELIGDRLILRGTLPPKPSSSRTKPYTQRIFLHVFANTDGIAFAEAEAKRLGGLIAQKRFDWAEVLPEESPQLKTNLDLTASELIVKFEKDFFTRKARTPKSENTWKTDYEAVYRHLPNRPLSEETILELIGKTEADSRQRKRYVAALRQLAKFAGLEADLSGLVGRYGPKSRDIPDDATIVEWYEKIPNPQWKYAYGVLATYGIRPHELWHLDFSEYPILRVTEDTKTEDRQVYALYPEWCDRFKLIEPNLPECTGKNNKEIGGRVGMQFRRYKVPFAPYDLRHGWALRAISFGIPPELAARMMGHDLIVHNRTYQKWLSAVRQKEEYERLIYRSDRPLPP